MRRQGSARASRTTIGQTTADSRPPARNGSSLQRIVGAGLVLATLPIATVTCSRTVRPLVQPDEPPATGFGQGTRNDLEGFEQQGFIQRVRGDRIDFDCSGIYRDVLATVTAAQVRWACARMSRLTDEQWSDAFRAGG
jgi:hypothetical protein